MGRRFTQTPYLQSNGYAQAQAVRDQKQHGQPTASCFEPIKSGQACATDKWSISLANIPVGTNSSISQRLR